MRAIVLKKTSYGESDLIVQFLLDDGTKVSGFAASAKRSQKRFPHQFHPAAIYEVDFSKKDQGDDQLRRVQRCELLEWFPQLSSNLDRLSRWAMILEWISLDRGSNFELEEIIQTMRALGSDEALWAYHSFFAQQIQSHGLIPQLKNCARCHEALLSDSRIQFSIHEGGVLHSHCGARGISLPNRTHQLLLSLFSAELFEEVPSAEVQPKAFKVLDEILLPYLEHQLDVRLKSRRFFDSLETEPLSAIST